MLKRDKDTSRNRSLTNAFFLSWLLWVVCWSPYFWGIYTDRTAITSAVKRLTDQSVASDELEFSLLRWLRVLYALSKNSIQMFYSHFNALIFIILLKLFRDWLRKIFTKTPKIWFSEVTVGSNGHGKKEPFGKNLKGYFVILTSLLFFLLASFSCLAGLSAWLSWTDSRKKVLQELQIAHSGFYFSHMRNEQWFNYSKDARFVCGENHAEINLEFNRCFFVDSHCGSGLNLSQQIAHCESRGSVLTYPRSYDEVVFIWEFYQSFRGWKKSTKFSMDDD